MLSRVAKLYQVPNWDATNSFLLAEWVVEEYRHYDFELIKLALRNPPKLSAEAWRITPDTIRAWVDFTNLKIEEERLRKESFKKQEIEQVKELEPLSEETQRMIRDWQADLLGLQPVPQISSVEIDRLKDEDRARLEGKSVKKGIDLSQFQTDAILAEKKALHIQYIRENYDPITSKPLPTWIAEDDWIAKQL